MTYGRLRQIRAALVERLSGLADALPQVVDAQPAAIVPSLALAYSIYGDIERADEIASRNRLARPGFVPARPIRVLDQ